MNLRPTGAAPRPELNIGTEAAVRLRAMDEQGIDVEALSINPYWYKADRDVTRKLIQLQNLRHLAAEAGAGQLVLGTDYPFPWTKTAVDHVLATPGLSDDQKLAVLGSTAMKLLGINA